MTKRTNETVSSIASEIFGLLVEYGARLIVIEFGKDNAVRVQFTLPKKGGAHDARA